MLAQLAQRYELSENTKKQIIFCMKWESVVTTTLFTTNQGFLAFNFGMQRLPECGADLTTTYALSTLSALITWIPMAAYVSYGAVVACDDLFTLEKNKFTSLSRSKLFFHYLGKIFMFFLSLNKALSFAGLGMLACETLSTERQWAFFGFASVQYIYATLGVICNLTFFLGIFSLIQKIIEKEIVSWKIPYTVEDEQPLLPHSKKHRTEQFLRTFSALLITSIAIVGISDFLLPATLAAKRLGYGDAAPVTSWISVIQMGMITFAFVYPLVRNFKSSEKKGNLQPSNLTIFFILLVGFISSTANVYVMEKFLKSRNIPPSSFTGIIFLLGSCLTWALPTIGGMSQWASDIKEAGGLSNLFKNKNTESAPYEKLGNSERTLPQSIALQDTSNTK